MPTYQYKCNKCDFEFEEEHRIADRNMPVENPKRYGTCSDESNDNCDIQLVPQLLSIKYMTKKTKQLYHQLIKKGVINKNIQVKKIKNESWQSARRLDIIMKTQ